MEKGDLRSASRQVPGPPGPRSARLSTAKTVVLAAILTGAGIPACAGPEQPPLNLVLVLVDTARADHLGPHGYERPTTPFLDTLAAESALFRSHHSHASRTGPSVASVFTGLHPRSHGVVNPLDVRDGKGALAREQLTLAELLTRAGYTCYGAVGNPNVNPKLGFGQGFQSYERLRPANASALTQRGIELLAERREPFFLYLHYMDPHSNYRAEAPGAGRFADPSYAGPATGTTKQLNRIVAGELELAPEDLAHTVALYDEELRAFDAGLQRLAEHLIDEGLWDRTLLAFVADHGEELLDHGSALHGYTLYQEQLHVPFLIRDPRIGLAREIEATSRHIDVLPTLLDLLGLAVPARVQGESLARWVREPRGAGEVGNRPVYAQASLSAVKTIALESYADGGWKLIRHRLPQEREELYHLELDPGEQRDLAGERPDELARLRGELEAFRAALPLAASAAVDLTEDEVDELRALGYTR